MMREPTQEPEHGQDFTLSAADAKELLGATSLPRDLRLAMLRKVIERHGAERLVSLFADFIGLSNTVVTNSREMIEMFAIEEGIDPHRAEKINLPTIFGALMGVTIADGIDLEPLCGGCAYRTGTPANQSPVTSCDADYLGHLGEPPFYCHAELDEAGEPTKACAGWSQLRARRKREEVT